MRICEDAPCCGCCDPRVMFRSEEPPEDDYPYYEDDADEYDDSMDGDHESALESVYGPSEDAFLDSCWEDQFEF